MQSGPKKACYGGGEVRGEAFVSIDFVHIQLTCFEPTSGKMTMHKGKSSLYLFIQMTDSQFSLYEVINLYEKHVATRGRRIT